MSYERFTMIVWLALVCWALGQIWFAQLVVYPLFGHVGAGEYRGYHRFYTARIPAPVIVPGFASFLLPVPLALFGPAVPTWLSAANVATGVVGLLVTVLLEIPRHNRLEAHGKDDVTIAELVRYNWPRTASITVQAVVAVAMLAHA